MVYFFNKNTITLKNRISTLLNNNFPKEFKILYSSYSPKYHIHSVIHSTFIFHNITGRGVFTHCIRLIPNSKIIKHLLFCARKFKLNLFSFHSL